MQDWSLRGYSRMVKIINVRDDSTKTHLYMIGDFHIGALGFEEDKLKKLVRRIKNDRFAKVIVMGDFCDAITSDDRRHNPNSIDLKYRTVQKQYLGIRDMLSPIKDKIIGVHFGNHDEVIWDKAEMNIPELLSIDFNTKYVEDFLLLKLRKGKHLFKIITTHGFGGSRTLGGNFNKLKQIIESFDFTPDIIGVGHFHRIDTILNCTVDENMKLQRKYFAFTGGFLNGYSLEGPTYISSKVMNPLPTGCVMFELYKDGTIVDNKILM